MMEPSIIWSFMQLYLKVIVILNHDGTSIVWSFITSIYTSIFASKIVLIISLQPNHLNILLMKIPGDTDKGRPWENAWLR